MSSIAIFNVWEHSQHGGAELMLLTFLADNSADGEGTLPPLGDLAKRIRMSESETHTLLLALIKSGEVEVLTSSRYAATRFYIHLPGMAYRQTRTPRQPHYRDIWDYMPTREKAAITQRIFERDGWACRVCGCMVDLGIDHIIPLARGGGNEDANLQTLCRPCNSRKGSRV